MPLEEEIDVSLSDKHLSVISNELETIPPFLAQKYGKVAESLDLSNNKLTVVDNLEGFTRLTNLVLDNNLLTSRQNFPVIPTLETLWVNNNKIDDIETFLTVVSKSFPNLTYLSLLKNPACPNFFNGKNQDDYKRYRLYVIHRQKSLKFLDSAPVTAAERKEAQRVGHLMVVARPEPQQYQKSANNHLEEIHGLDPSLTADNLKARSIYGNSGGVEYDTSRSEGNRFIINSDL